MRHVALFALTLITLSGCPTAFRGSAYVADGRGGCERKCKSQGLVFSSLVFMGEYSSACVCEPKRDKGEAAKSASAPSSAAPAAAAATGAAIGNMEQTHSPDEPGDPIIISE
jgi:hypothetical protein